MIEMKIGSRFWYNGNNSKLCEVVETKAGFACDRCVFDEDRYTCDNTECRASKRHDGKYVCFKEVKE